MARGAAYDTIERYMERTFTQRVIDIVASIPAGRVTNYGTVAAMAGKPRGARAVVWALRSDRSVTTPWHRVVNRKGELGDHDGTALQRVLLEDEGVCFDDRGRIDLAAYGWPRE